MNLNLEVQQSNEIDASDLEGEKVMMNLELGKYFALNPVASRIWDIINKKITINDIVAILLNEYNVDKKQCEDSVISFLEKLEEYDLIKVYG